MIIGTAGHIDHGKTSLVHALTGVYTDRLKEEKLRGISIDLGFAYLATANGPVLGFVDVPGHEKFVRNMLAGSTGIDFVVLVVAADDGVKPQTVEHLAIVDLLGKSRGLIALTKVDRVSVERRLEVIEEIQKCISLTALAGAHIAHVSSVTGEGIAALREKLVAAAREGGQDYDRRLFRLAVDRCFTITGAGTIVTGTVLSGIIAVGDLVIVSPAGLTARVRAIHAQNKPAQRGVMGERCALNLVGDAISRSAINRGDIVLDPALHAPTDRIDASLRVLSSELKPIGQWTPVRLYHATCDVAARVALLQDTAITPGENGIVQLVLETSVAATIGDSYILRDTSGSRTLGGGRFLNLRGPTRKRRAPERLTELSAQALIDPLDALRGLLSGSKFPIDVAKFATDRALSRSFVDECLEHLGSVVVHGSDATIAFSRKRWLDIARELRIFIDGFHAANPKLLGAPEARVIRVLGLRHTVGIMTSIFKVLVREGYIVVEGGLVRAPGHKLSFNEEDDILLARLVPLLLGVGRFRPPSGGDLAVLLHEPAANVRRVLKLLRQRRELFEVGPDIFFPRATMAEMLSVATRLSAVAPDKFFTAAQFRDDLNNGRKIAILVLEYFDRVGVTARRGDLRRVNPQKLDLFEKSANFS